MKEKQFYTTGEASQLLKISRATISRKFDSRILLGKRNPITGERLISHESIVSFMRKYNLMMPMVVEEEGRIRSTFVTEKKSDRYCCRKPE